LEMSRTEHPEQQSVTPGSNMDCVLVVDDSAHTREILQRNLSAEGYRVLLTNDVPGAVAVLDSTRIDLVVTDLKMPGSSGLDLVQHVQDNFRDTEVVMITGYPSIESAVHAVKGGAEAYLPKPFTNEELLAAVERALEKVKRRRTQTTVAAEDKWHVRHGLVGRSEPMQKVYRAIEKAASTSATVLISGESGTGKELVARAIHYMSPRAASAFVPVNCGAIPTELLESELFGHSKGAFTGAATSRAGFFHTADGGTVFLDEISEASLSMQVKLLRVLQDRQVRMVGSDTNMEVDVRVLAATNRDLAESVQKGTFRPDLYYRLDVIPVVVPPLRDRGDDILALCRHFAEGFAAEAGIRVPEFSDEALGILREYSWPGNVRELENVVQHLVVMTDEKLIDVPHLPSLMRFSALSRRNLQRTLEEITTEHILNVLASVDGNKTRAARILGVDRKTLRAKLNRISG
jgi:two-component system response regulator HydG